MDNEENDFFLIDEKHLKGQLLCALRSKNFHSFKDAIEYGNQSTTLNVNYDYLNTSEETCLDIASRTGLTKFVKFLLHKGAEPNRINNVHNCAPIHFATEGGHVHTLAALLDEPTINLNLEAGQQTALHIAVRKNDLTCAGLLLENGASADISNSAGVTALYFAATEDRRDMVALILEKSQQCLQQSLPPECEKRELIVHVLKYYLNANDETNFLKSMELVETEIFHCEAEELLEIAVQHKFYNAVIEILEKFKGSLNIRKAAEAAVQQSDHAILQVLLQVEPNAADDLILSACLELGMPGKRGSDNTPDRLECLKLILEDVDIHRTDNKGNTPLHHAVKANCTEAITLLLNRGSCIGHMNKFKVPPIANIPSRILSRYFNDCLRIREEWTNEDVVEFDYRCLMPHDVLTKHDDDRRTTREMEVFQYIAGKSDLKHLLKHPLLSSFLYLKRHNVRHVMCVKFIFYMMFYVLPYAHILCFNLTDESKAQIVNNCSYTTFKDLLQNVCYQNNILWIIIIVLWIFVFFGETFKFIFLTGDGFHYLKSLDNLLDIIVIGLTFFFICGANQVCIVLIPLSVWKIIIMLSFQDISTSYVMFWKVSVNYVHLFKPFIIAIIIFILAFFSFFKDIFFPNSVHSLCKFFEIIIEFSANSSLIYIVLALVHFFVITVAVNLLNGLAVNDATEILSEAKLIGLIFSISEIAYIEDIAMGKLFRYCCGNSGLSRIIWNSFGFFAKKIFLFPHYLRNDNVRSYDSVKNYNKLVANDDIHSEPVNYGKYYSDLGMDPSITKQAKQIILNKNQLSDKNITELKEQMAEMKEIISKFNVTR